MLVDLLVLVCAASIVVAALAVLHGCKRAEISLRALAALLLGAWGAWLVASTLQPHAASTWTDLLGPAGVALWIGQAARRRRGAPMRRSSDWTELDNTRPMERDGDLAMTMTRILLGSAAVALALLAVFAQPAHADVLAVPGDWDLYAGTKKLSSHPKAQACVDAAAARNITRHYTCRARIAVHVYHERPVPPASRPLTPCRMPDGQPCRPAPDVPTLPPHDPVTPRTTS